MIPSSSDQVSYASGEVNCSSKGDDSTKEDKATREVWDPVKDRGSRFHQTTVKGTITYDNLSMVTSGSIFTKKPRRTGKLKLSNNNFNPSESPTHPNGLLSQILTSNPNLNKEKSPKRRLSTNSIKSTEPLVPSPQESSKKNLFKSFSTWLDWQGSLGSDIESNAGITENTEIEPKKAGNVSDEIFNDKSEEGLNISDLDKPELIGGSNINNGDIQSKNNQPIRGKARGKISGVTPKSVTRFDSTGLEVFFLPCEIIPLSNGIFNNTETNEIDVNFMENTNTFNNSHLQSKKALKQKYIETMSRIWHWRPGKDKSESADLEDEIFSPGTHRPSEVDVPGIDQIESEGTPIEGFERSRSHSSVYNLFAAIPTPAGSGNSITNTETNLTNMSDELSPSMSSNVDSIDPLITDKPKRQNSNFRKSIHRLKSKITSPHVRFLSPEVKSL